MKKVLMCLISILIFTGCGEKNITLDLEKVEIELNSLEIEEDSEKVKLFDKTSKVDKEILEDKYQMDTDVFEEILLSTSSKVGVSSMYIVYLPKKGRENECKQQINDFFETYEQNWTLYFPEEEALVKNRSEEKYGNYYIYIVSKDNDLALKKIKNTK